MIDVMFYEVFSEEQKALQKYLPKNIQAGFTKKTIQESKHKTPPAALISIRTQSVVPSSWVNKIKGVLTRSQGFDHLIKFRRESKTNIPCGYLGDYCSGVVAEHAIISMMILNRKIKKQIRHFEVFNRDELTGFQSRGKKVFIIGVGAIGTKIVQLSRALKMSVKGYDIDKRVKNLSYVSLKNGIKWADVIFCALPLTTQTEGLLSFNVLKHANPGVVFINISRAEISPLKDLEKLLKNKTLGGLSLDVFPNEHWISDALRAKKKINEPHLNILRRLKDQDNVLFTPHNAFNTHEALQRKAILSVQAIKSFLKSGKFPFVIK